MQNQWLIKEFKPQERPAKQRRENKAQVIRNLLSTGISDKEIEEETGYKRSYILKIKNSLDSHMRSRVVRKCKNLLVGELFPYEGLDLRFIRYSKDSDGDTFVYFENENGKIDNMYIDCLIGEARDSYKIWVDRFFHNGVKK